VHLAASSVDVARHPGSASEDCTVLAGMPGTVRSATLCQPRIQLAKVAPCAGLWFRSVPFRRRQLELPQNTERSDVGLHRSRVVSDTR
jgi:hypothetical protein